MTATNRSVEDLKYEIASKEAELESILRHFGDSKSMNYFTDRFGFEHSLSETAEKGVRLEREIRELKRQL